MTNYRVQEQTYIVDRVFDRAQLILGPARRLRKWRSAVNNNLKDSSDSNTQDVKPIEAPAGLDLHPKPNTSVRISKRAGWLLAWWCSDCYWRSPTVDTGGRFAPSGSS